MFIHIQGNISLEKSARRKPYDWLPDQGWEDIIKLCSIQPDIFGSLADDIENNEKAWKEVNDRKSPLAHAYINSIMI